MSKKFKSQASSARAASTAFGNASSFGSGSSTGFQTSTSLLSYVNEQADLSAISQPTVVVAFKNLSKKDSTTKEKALDELNGYLSTGAATGGLAVEDSVIDAWTSIYPRTSIDNSRRVRQLAHNFQGTLTALNGKRIVPYLPKVIGAWLAGTFDQDRAVARAASDALQKSFTTVEKRKALWKLYQKALIDYVEDAATIQSAQTLSDERSTSPDDAEAKHVRVVASALSVFKTLLLEQSDKPRQGVEEAICDLLQSTKLWQHAHNADPSVRRACYTLFTTSLARRPGDINWKVISASFVGKSLHTSQLGSTGSFTEALLAITRAHPESWTTEYTFKTAASKRLLKFLQQGSQRGPSVFWGNISHLIELLPKEVWNSSSEGAPAQGDLDPQSTKQILEAFRAGIANVDEPRQNLRVAWESYVEVAVWLCKQLPEADARNSILNDHLLPLIREYVIQDNKVSGFTIPISGAVGICVKGLGDIAVNFGFFVLDTFWKDLSQDVLEAVRTSQPEQSSNFRTSQNQIAAQGRRFFGVAAGLLDVPVQARTGSVEGTLSHAVTSLIEQCTIILKNRVCKPYGAASVVKDAVETLTSTRSPSLAGSIRSIVLDFLNDQLDVIADSPSAEILISMLLNLRRDPAASEKVERIIESLLSRDEFDATKPAIQSIILHMEEPDLQQYPNVKKSLLGHLESVLGSSTGLWTSITAILRQQSATSEIKEEMLSRMMDGLSIDGTARSSIRGFDSLLQDNKNLSVEQIIGSSNTSSLLSKLLVLEESPNEETSHDARDLAEHIQTNLEKAGLATKASLEIIRQQLSLVGEEALSIHTIIELARDALATKSNSNDVSFGDVFPGETEWKQAVDSFLQDCPPHSTAITSILQGAALMTDAHEANLSVKHDANGFSAAVRLALFTTKVMLIAKDLEDRTPSRKQALYKYLPLALQVVNEKLDISNANDSWVIETQEVEDEMAILVSDGRKLLQDLISQQVQSDTLNTLPEPATVESCWLKELQSVTDYSPQSYRLALAFAEILSTCIDRTGATRYSSIWTDALADIRKSSNTFRSAALVVISRIGLLPSKKLCTELVVDVTEVKRNDQEATALSQTIVLNLLLSGEEDLLATLPPQRLVYLVKAVVGSLGHPGQKKEELSEMLKLLTLVLPSVASIYDEFWKDLWVSVTSMMTEDQVTQVDIPFLSAAVKLFALYKRLAAEESNDDLVEVWEEYGKDLPGILLGSLIQYNKYEQDPEQMRSSQIGNEELSSARHQPRSIVMGMLGRLMARLPVDHVNNTEEIFPLLTSNEREVQSTVFDLLHRKITDRQEQLSLDLALSKQAAHIPEELLSLLLDAPTMEEISESTQLSDIRWVGPRSYLLAWKLLFDHFTKASHKLREMYAEDIKASGHLGSLLAFVNDLLKISSARPVDASRFSIDKFDFDETRTEPQLIEAQALGVHMYYLCLLYLPNLTRTWWFESKNKVKGPLENWTQKQVTPRLCKAAMSAVNEWMTTLDNSDDEDHPLEVKISPNSTELVASITVDPESAPVSLMISLPPAYPLQQATVTSRNRVAVSESNWQSWLRTIRGIIMFSNGSIIDGLLAFRRNVQGALKGQTECAICYSIIGTDMKTPDKRCGTCKRLFHGGCLLRWFRSSSSSSCPLCRNNFSYA